MNNILIHHYYNHKNCINLKNYLFNIIILFLKINLIFEIMNSKP